MYHESSWKEYFFTWNLKSVNCGFVQSWLIKVIKHWKLRYLLSLCVRLKLSMSFSILFHTIVITIFIIDSLSLNILKVINKAPEKARIFNTTANGNINEIFLAVNAT